MSFTDIWAHKGNYVALEVIMNQTSEHVKKKWKLVFRSQPQYTEDNRLQRHMHWTPNWILAPTFSFTKLSICTSVGFFTFWLAALCLSCWLAAAGFWLWKPQFPVSESRVYLVVFLQKNFKRKLCLPMERYVCLFAPAVQWPASTRLLLWAFVASSISCGLQASGYFAAGRGGNMSRRGSRLLRGL